MEGVYQMFKLNPVIVGEVGEFEHGGGVALRDSLLQGVADCLLLGVEFCDADVLVRGQRDILRVFVAEDKGKTRPEQSLFVVFDVEIMPRQNREAFAVAHHRAAP